MTDRTELERQIAELQAKLAALDADPDPLLIEAREICAIAYEGWQDKVSASNFHKGFRDGGPDMSIALAALRRGIELGKSS